MRAIWNVDLTLGGDATHPCIGRVLSCDLGPEEKPFLAAVTSAPSCGSLLWAPGTSRKQGGALL
jgi:hypothetical protein